MFQLFRRLFGAGTPAIPPDGVPRTVATVDVQDYAGPGARLVARDAAGTSLLAVRVSARIAPFLATRFDAAWGTGAAPDGDYVIEAVLPARVDETGIALFGPNPMLRLRALAGGASRPGRTTLLIHGGPDGDPTDGSIRMGDADLAALLALLPDDPGQVRVRLARGAPDDADDGTDRDGSGGDDGWVGDDAEPYYGQLYDWAGTVPDAPPYPDIPAGDEGVGAALAGLGFAAPSYGGTGAAGTAETGGAGAASASGTDPAWAPAGGAYTP